MHEEIDVTVKIHLDHWQYNSDWSCEAQVVYTNTNNQSITLNYDTEYRGQCTEEIAKDLRECLDDHEDWWSDKLLKGNDLVLKIREAEKQMKHSQAEAKSSREWATRHEEYAARYEKQLRELQSQAKDKTNE